MMQILQTLWPLVIAAFAGFGLNALQQQLQQMAIE